MVSNLEPVKRLPDWVPSAVRLYLSHTECGRSLRAIARDEGLHASTVMRQVRRFESRRDDPLVDDALGRLRQAAHPATDPAGNEARTMTSSSSPEPDPLLDEARLLAEARRVLRRMAEAGAMMAVAADMERAVVLRDGPEGAMRLAVLDRPVAEAFALRDWIACTRPGRVARYEITAAGRAMLRRMLGEADTFAAAQGAAGAADEEEPRARGAQGESPVAALARRRDRAGRPFLAPALVTAAERLREDFEIAQMGSRVTQDWEGFLTGGVRGGRGAAGGVPGGSGARAAQERVAAALRDLGPGLGDVALRCCCHLEGLETAERRMGWSARSGKIVLRIALERLARHYEAQGDAGKMMG